MQEHHLRVYRTARYVTIGAPGPGIAHVWFACHGYRQLAARFARPLEALDDGRHWVFAPEALSRFYLEDGAGAIGPHGPESRVGATWMTREDRLTEIRDYVAYLDALHDEAFRAVPRAQARVTLLGFSQGTATAARWAAFGRARIDRLVLWGWGAPPDLDLAVLRDRLEGAPVLLVAGRQDPATPAERVAQEAGRLTAAGIRAETLWFDGGHALDEGVLRGIAAAAV